MFWQTHAQTVRCVHSCPALYDNKVSRAVHSCPALYDNSRERRTGLPLRAHFRTSSVPIRHYARGQRSPDSAIVCVGRNPIDTISPEMGLKEHAACALHTRIPRNVAWGCLSIIGLGTCSVQCGCRVECVSCPLGGNYRCVCVLQAVFSTEG